MYSALAAFLMAMVVGTVLTPIVRRAALHFGAVDTPGGRRVHKGVIPRMGGVAITIAFFCPMLVLYLLNTGVAQIFYADPLRIVGLAAGGVLICSLGVYDDLKGVRAWYKLIVQIVAAIIAFSCGFRIDAVSLPLLGHLEMGIFAAPVTVIWIVGIVNAVNLIDGLDGLAGGIAFFACVANFIVGAMHGNALVMLISAALAGAVFAFLIYNFNPATIFMGDAGSMFLGFVLALTGLMGASVKHSTTITILVPALALGVPIADTTLSMARRFLRGKSIFSADRGHIHHRLLDLGLTQRRAVLVLYGLSALFVLAAVYVSIGRIWEVGGAILVASTVAIGLVLFVRNTERVRMKHEAEQAANHMLNVQRLRREVRPAIVAMHTAEGLEDFEAALGLLLEPDGQIFSVGLTSSGIERALSIHHRRSDGEGDKEERKVGLVELPVPCAVGEVTLSVGFCDENIETPPEVEILLGMVVDGVEAWLEGMPMSAMVVDELSVEEQAAQSGEIEGLAHAP